MNKVFIIGLPRTGTTSISVALLDYGFKVAHTASTKRAFELADVISDAPCFSDYEQLDKLFPDSKFVYLDRELTNWLPSIQRLLTKMKTNLAPQTGHFNPVLKRSFREVFGLLNTKSHLEQAYLETCYHRHKDKVFKYFSNRNDLLKIDISKEESLQALVSFLGISTINIGCFPKLNVGKQVDSWKEYKHPGKVNSNSAGKEHRKFFDYAD